MPNQLSTYEASLRRLEQELDRLYDLVKQQCHVLSTLLLSPQEDKLELALRNALADALVSLVQTRYAVQDSRSRLLAVLEHKNMK